MRVSLETGYDSAAEFAREARVHRTTVVAWIKKGIIQGHKGRERNCTWKMSFKENINPKKLKKKYDKYSKPYTDLEVYILKNNKHLSSKVIAKMINRNENSVKIKRCRLRKLGIDV